MHTVNLDKCLAHPKILGVTKALIYQLKTNPFLSPGEFFKKLAEADVNVLSQLADSAHKEDQDAIMNMVILAEVLALGEMSMPENDQVAEDNVNLLSIYISMVSLHRKGIIDLNYENISFNADMATAPLATPRITGW